MLKKFKFIFLSIFIIGLLTGCSNVNTSISYTYSVETGDSVVVTLNQANNYKLNSSLPFSVSKDDTVLCQGLFINSEYFKSYWDAITLGGDATVIDSGTKDGNQYIFWTVNETEYNYMMSIKDSNTAVIVGNYTTSPDEVTEGFNLLEFNIAN